MPKIFHIMRKYETALIYKNLYYSVRYQKNGNIYEIKRYLMNVHRQCKIYLKDICFDVENNMYNNSSDIDKKKIKIIGRKIKYILNILKKRNVPINKKLKEIEKLNKALINYLENVQI